MLGPIGAVTRKLVNADAGGFLRLFEDMGRDAVLDLVGGGSSPIGLLVNAFLGHAQRTSRQNERDEQRADATANKKPSKTALRAAKVRHQEWLKDNKWRFDWRSQPRRPRGSDAGGEWMEGRLQYQAETKNAYSRSVMRRRTRSMRQYKTRMKAMGHTTTRTIRSKWGDF